MDLFAVEVLNNTVTVSWALEHEKQRENSQVMYVHVQRVVVQKVTDFLGVKVPSNGFMRSPAAKLEIYGESSA